MFSQNLFDALCQTRTPGPESNTVNVDEAAMMQAIERAMGTYQRLFSNSEPTK